MTHLDNEQHIAAYLLGSLDEGERRRAEPELIEHIAGCDPCRELYVALKETTSDLALVAEPIAMSPEFEDRVLGAVRAEGVDTLAARRAQRVPKFARKALVASIAAVLALSGTTAYLYSSRQEERRLQQQAAAIIHDPAAAHVDLCKEEARCNVSVLPSGKGVLVAANLPAPPEGKVMELWLLKEGIPTPAKVFEGVRGQVWLLFEVAPGHYDHAAITIEPGPHGTQRPTGPMIYSGELTA
ncbi:MAG TPA: anti-sigma factor [Actinomycetota bacterium]|nr:anti-sigma factor [Actinomycetota bacterium]